MLLASWDGDLQPGDGNTANDQNYVRFVAKKTTITTEDTDEEDAFRLGVVLPGATEPVCVPVGSEKKEFLARPISIALTIEEGGAERFRTKSSCIARMDSTTVTVHHHLFSRCHENGEFNKDSTDHCHEEAHAHQWITFGVENGEGMEARLEVLGSGYLDARGVALESEMDDAQPLMIRRGRKLFAYVHERKLDLPKGVSKIPIAVCEPIDKDGTVVVERPQQGDELEIRIAGLGVTFDERATFATDLSSVGEETKHDENQLALWGAAAKRLLGKLGVR